MSTTPHLLEPCRLEGPLSPFVHWKGGQVDALKPEDIERHSEHDSDGVVPHFWQTIVV